MTYASGLKVKHPKCPDWGVGQVLAEDESNHVEVVFDQVGLKRLRTDYVQLQPAGHISANASKALEQQVNQHLKANRRRAAWKDDDGVPSAKALRRVLMDDSEE